MTLLHYDTVSRVLSGRGDDANYCFPVVSTVSLEAGLGRYGERFSWCDQHFGWLDAAPGQDWQSSRAGGYYDTIAL